jgi:LacI family transcriptional regulator
LKFTRVLEDTAEAAQWVADHFLSRGFRNFLFYSDAENWVYNERGQGFQAALKQAGRNVQWLRWHESASFRADRMAWKRKREWLAAEIKRAPKPVGLFAASDGLALEAMETCEATGTAVPEEVAIVGAGNSLLAVDAMRTPISSVDTNLETLGYRGAQELDRLMHRKSAPVSAIRVSPFRLIVRKSSDLVAVSHPGVARSLRFMWEHCHEPIGVDDLARVAGMSTRSFHQAFVQYLGRPPGAEIHRIRIEYAKRLLVDSDEKMDVIAEKCGYQSSNSLWVAFKQATGISPKKYRTQWAAASSNSRGHSS